MQQLIAYDLGLLYFAGSQHHPSVTPLMLVLHQWGGFLGMTALTLVGILAFRLPGRNAEALALLAAGLLALLFDISGKYLVNRQRPAVAWRLVELPMQPSFPSGHALGSLAVC